MAEYPSSSQTVRYGKCEHINVLDNGSTLLDGCGEFFPGGSEGLFCAACGCHRSFHRREEVPINNQNKSFLADLWVDEVAISNGKESFWDKSFWPDDVMEKLVKLPSPSSPPPPPPPFPPTAEASSEAGRATVKRRRTKFTGEQRAKMKEFAQDSGWRKPKQDTAKIEEFCKGIEIEPKAYKIWVKNNKKVRGERSG